MCGQVETVPAYTIPKYTDLSYFYGVKRFMQMYDINEERGRGLGFSDVCGNWLGMPGKRAKSLPTKSAFKEALHGVAQVTAGMSRESAVRAIAGEGCRGS